MLALLVRQGRSLRCAVPLRRGVVRPHTAARFLSAEPPRRRLAEFDSIFFEDVSTGERRSVPPVRDDGDYFDYDPELDAMGAPTIDDGEFEEELEDEPDDEESPIHSAADWGEPSAPAMNRGPVRPPFDRDELSIKASSGGPIDRPDVEPSVHPAMEWNETTPSSAAPEAIVNRVPIRPPFARDERYIKASSGGPIDELDMLATQTAAEFPSAPTTVKREPIRQASDRDELYIKASSGGPIDSTIEQLQKRLLELQQEIYQQNDSQEFNLNSHKQVSSALFGNPDQKTNKETLEAMGGAGNKLADMILRYRQTKQSIRRQERKEENAAKRVTSFSKTAPDKPVASMTPPEQLLPEERKANDDPLLLVDASAYIFRAYFSMPPMHRSDGMPIGAVMGFCSMLNKLVLTRLLAGDEPRLVLVFDAKGHNFRHELYPEYKANRPECPIDLVPQFDLIREAAKAYGIPEVEAHGFEADDVIATLATMAIDAGLDTHVLSGDKDLMQLVTPTSNDPYVHMIDPMSMARIDYNAVVGKWGVAPDLVGDILALAGDTADNVPGVPGVGPKIAATLLQEYGSLTELLNQVDSVPQKGRREKLTENKDLALLSRQLVELDRSIPVDKLTTYPVEFNDVASLRMEPVNSERMLAFCDAMGFQTLKRTLKGRFCQASSSSPRQKVPVVKRRKNSWRRPKAGIPQPQDYADVPF